MKPKRNFVGTYVSCLGRAGLEEPVKAETPVVSDGGLQLIPLSIAQQVHLAQNEAVLFFCVGLTLVGAILKLQLLQQNAVQHRKHETEDTLVRACVPTLKLRLTLLQMHAHFIKQARNFMQDSQTLPG